MTDAKQEVTCDAADMARLRSLYTSTKHNENCDEINRMGVQSPVPYSDVSGERPGGATNPLESGNTNFAGFVSGYDPGHVSLRNVSSRGGAANEGIQLPRQYHPIDVNATSKKIPDTHSTSLSLRDFGTAKHSEMTLGVAGRSEGNAGGVSSYQGIVHGMPQGNTEYVSGSIHYPTKGKSGQRLSNEALGEEYESMEKGTEKLQQMGQNNVVSRMEFDGTYRREPIIIETGLEHDRRGSIPCFAAYQLDYDGMNSAEIRRQKSLKRPRNEAETFEFASCESDQDAVKKASLRRTSWQVGHEGGIGMSFTGDETTREALRYGQDYDKAEEGGFGRGVNYGVMKAGVRRTDYDEANEGGFGTGMNHGVKKAGILKTNYDKAEEGGFGRGMNYGVMKAGIRSNEWNEGFICSIGNGKESKDSSEGATIERSSWGRARRRYLSDSCILDDDHDEYFEYGGNTFGYSSQEDLRLPATPCKDHSLSRDRSYSLPDNLDDDYDYTWGCEDGAFSEASKKKLVDAINVVVKPKRDSLRRGYRGSARRRHPDEVGLIMRRGWFDVRKSIRVKVSWE